ncbi:MAG: peptidase M15 [Prevotella sp.]|nr:peptidase M15 [Prevotella sp.]
MKMKLSRNFTLAEMVATSHRKLQDTPTLDVIQNLQKLCVLVLQPLRDKVGAPVYINSGYRSKRLNAKVGGVPNSRHLLGKAADIHCDNLAYAKVIFDILIQNPNVDKVLIEKKGRYVWVHVQM